MDQATDLPHQIPNGGGAPPARQPGCLDAPDLAQALLDANPSPTVLLDEDGRIVAVNAAWRALTAAGGDAGGGLGEPYLAIFAGATNIAANLAEAAAQGIRAVLAREYRDFQIEYAGGGADEPHWYLLRAQRLDVDGPVSAIVSHQNITPRKRAEAALRQSEASYRTLIEHLPAVTYTAALDEASSALYVSPQIEALLGFSPEEWLADPSLWLRQIHPDDRELALERLRRARASLQPQSTQVRMLARDGRVVWVRDDVVVVRDQEGDPLFVLGIGQDITESKQVEEALREREARLRMLADQLPAVVWSVDHELRFTSGHGRGLTALDIRPGEALGRSLMDYQRSPESSAVAVAAHRQALGGVPITYELEIGGRTFQAHVEPWRDMSGAIVGAIGVALDITDAKRMRTALAEHQRWLQALFDNAEDAFLLVDDQGRYVDANAAALRLIGYTREELLRLEIWDVTPVELRERAIEGWRVFRGEGRRQGEFPLLRKDGTTVETDFRAIADIMPGLHLSIVRDISERKRVEARQARHAEDLARLAEAERQRQVDLARSNTLITALSHVAARIERTSEPDGVMTTLGRELRPLGITCMIALLDPGDGALEVAYTSIDPSTRAALESIIGASMYGFRLARALLPGYADLIEHRRSLVVARPSELVSRLLPSLPPRSIAKILRLVNLGAGSRAIYLPLIVEDAVQGVLWLWGAGLREADLPAVTVFASQVASALDRARLFARLRELSRQLVDTQELERRELARELHDQIGQNLAVLNISLAGMRVQLSPASAARIEASFVEAQKLIDETIDRIRDRLAELRPTALDDYGLAAVLQWYVPHAARRMGLAGHVSADEQAPRPPANAEIALFRIAQEALTNVAKHARASQVSVTLETKQDRTRLIIADDGIGFDAARPRRPDQRWGLGLVGMRERVEALGGQLRVDSAPGRGTRVIAEVARNTDAD